MCNSDYTAGTHLLKDLRLDSLGIMSIDFDCEKHFQLRGVFENITGPELTVGALVERIRNRLQSATD